MFEIRLYKSRRKSLGLLLISSISTGAIGFILYNNISDNIWIYLGLILFGLGMMVSLFNMIDTRAQIIINGDGIFDRHTKIGTIPWHSILFAESIIIQKQNYIGLHCTEHFTSAKRNYRVIDMMKEKLNLPQVILYTNQLTVSNEALCEFINELKNADSKQHKMIAERFKTFNSII